MIESLRPTVHESVNGKIVANYFVDQTAPMMPTKIAIGLINAPRPCGVRRPPIRTSIFRISDLRVSA